MTTSDFERFAALHIQDRASWCEVPEFGDGAALKLKPANESNGQYYSAKIKAQARRPRMGGATGKIVVDMEAILRREDRDLFPKYVVCDWRGLKNGAGAEVPFSVPKCQELLSEGITPSWLFDRIRSHAVIPENFLPDGEESADPTDLAKNSGGGSSGN